MKRFVVTFTALRNECMLSYVNEYDDYIRSFVIKITSRLSVDKCKKVIDYVIQMCKYGYSCKIIHLLLFRFL